MPRTRRDEYPQGASASQRQLNRTKEEKRIIIMMRMILQGPWKKRQIPEPSAFERERVVMKFFDAVKFRRETSI